MGVSFRRDDRGTARADRREGAAQRRRRASAVGSDGGDVRVGAQHPDLAGRAPSASATAGSSRQPARDPARRRPGRPRRRRLGRRRRRAARGSRRGRAGAAARPTRRVGHGDSPSRKWRLAVHGDVGDQHARARRRDCAAGRPAGERAGSGPAWSAASRRTRTARPAGRSRPARGRAGSVGRAARARRRRCAARSASGGTRKRIVAVGDRRGSPAPRRAARRGSSPAASSGAQPRPHEGDLPGGVLGVRDPGVEAAGAERRDEVGGVAGEQHPPDPHPVDDPGVEPVDRLPHDLVVGGRR